MNLKEEIQKKVEEAIDSVLNGELDLIKLNIPVNGLMVRECMDARGFVGPDFGSSGWEYDWWWTFTKDNKLKYVAGGSWYRGKFEFYKEIND